MVGCISSWLVHFLVVGCISLWLVVFPHGWLHFLVVGCISLWLVVFPHGWLHFLVVGCISLWLVAFHGSNITQMNTTKCSKKCSACVHMELTFRGTRTLNVSSLDA